MVHRVKFKAETHGPCRLCREDRKLTWDHVPPKACGNQSSTEIASFANTVGEQPDAKRQISQNGLKFRTLCSDCNNSILGAGHDLQIADFFSSLRTIVKSSLRLPDVIAVQCQPESLIRGILGHLVASKVDLHQTVFDEHACEYVLNGATRVPDDIHIYGWVHPYPDTLILRDFAIKIGNTTPFCQFLATFPFAFLVCSEIVQIDAVYLNDYIQVGSSLTSVPIRIRPVKPYGWPWHTDFSGMMFGGQALMESPFARIRR